MSYDNYNRSNAVRIILQTDIDFSITIPTSVDIIYISPDTTTEATWSASILLGSETDGKIYYDMTTSDALTTGDWYVKAKLTYSDSRVLYSEWGTISVGE